MQQYYIKHDGKQYKAEADNVLFLLAAVMRKFNWPQKVITISGKENVDEDDDQIFLYAPDNDSRDNLVGCRFDKFYSDNFMDIERVIKTIERIDLDYKRKYILF